MSQKFLFFAAVCLGTASLAAAQTAVQVQGATTPARIPPALQKAIEAPTESDVYCAGYFTHRFVEPALFVLGGEDGGLKYEYGDRDVLYLSKGKGWINAPGGQYMLLRPIKDLNPKESFPGQKAVVSRMGTLYAEIARIEVRILHEGSATAEVLHACEPVLAGDIAIPLAARPAPPYKAAAATDRFAPSSGKATGVVAAIKEFQQAAGADHVIYLNVGKNQGAQVGSYLRIFRTFTSGSQDMIVNATRNYPQQIMGVTVGRKLTRQERNSLPRTVLGEVLILSSEDETATGIITYSWQDIYPGDQVEVE